MTTYRDFEDLRDRAPAAYRAAVAIDLDHADPARLAPLWEATADGELRLALTGAAGSFWERELRRRDPAVPEDHFAVEVALDSYADPEMGHTLYLEATAWCGSEAVGELCWRVLEDDALERVFADHLAGRLQELLAARADTEGLLCTVEVTEVEEL